MKFISPMMPKLVDAALAGEGWIDEVKFGARLERRLSLNPRPSHTLRRSCHAGPPILDEGVYLPDARGAADFHGLSSAITDLAPQLHF